jgi:hypothetical protein
VLTRGADNTDRHVLMTNEGPRKEKGGREERATSLGGWNGSTHLSVRPWILRLVETRPEPTRIETDD